MKMNRKFLNEALAVAEDAAIGAGKILVSYAKKIDRLKIDRKKAQGVVSEADIKSELFIRRVLKKNYPTHEFLGEESSYLSHGNSKKIFEKFKTVDACWVVDPLDGTSNFLNGFDYYSVCISLMVHGVPVVGLVYRPSDGTCYFAKSGHGSFVKNLKENGRPRKIHSLQNNKPLKDCLMVTGFAHEKGEAVKKEFQVFLGLMKKTRGIRRLGGAALDMCLVAEGILDGFWERGLAPWDVAAASVICQEAGVKVTDYDGVLFNPFQESIVAARSPVMGKLRRNLYL